ncbi:MAG: undecaprenyldiphospho-muramoylpentapeptide beta-N-acetylglucosaminyltransferase [Prochlorococcus sp. SP3034]|nr:undecaprenyldiphospho-muramoylpentapeptide beta-N-acetylglucosaminyltransferase [Prochlorococcus sp. SP3034]|tara:strand:+ start:641 stop:1723 length:1083 start_codon:yes stop_codon:yes gene_type:complete
MSKGENNLLIAASGTGGHIFPALAIAEDVESSWNIYWLGIKNRCESNLVPSKYNFLYINIKSPSKKNLFLLFQYISIIISAIEVVKIIKINKISLVFTTGGYISAPTIIAAKILGIPVIIHESNLIPGTVTKYFGRFCNHVLIGFDRTKFILKNCKITFTGTPLRDQFYITNRLPAWVPKGKGPLIIVMGGSQGAKAVNEIIYESLNFLLEKNIRVIHILGESKIIDSKYKNKKNYLQINFTKEIASLLQNCDLVISRSGAMTINELIKTKKPSILIPYPNSKNNHQEENAMVLASIGGSIIINQDNRSKFVLKDILGNIFKLDKNNNKYPLLEIMKKNMEKINSADTKEKIKKLINGYL